MASHQPNPHVHPLPPTRLQPSLYPTQLWLHRVVCGCRAYPGLYPPSSWPGYVFAELEFLHSRTQAYDPLCDLQDQQQLLQDSSLEPGTLGVLAVEQAYLLPGVRPARRVEKSFLLRFLLSTPGTAITHTIQQQLDTNRTI